MADRGPQPSPLQSRTLATWLYPPTNACAFSQAAHEALERQHHRLRLRSRSQQRLRTSRSGGGGAAMTCDLRASSSSDALRHRGSGVGSDGGSAPQDPTLLLLVSRCLSQLDARQMAELATLRGSPTTTLHAPPTTTLHAPPTTASAPLLPLPATPTGSTSASFLASLASPFASASTSVASASLATPHAAAAATPPSAASLSGASLAAASLPTSPASPASAAASGGSGGGMSAGSEWRAKLRSTLNDVAAAAAAAGTAAGGIHGRAGLALPMSVQPPPHASPPASSMASPPSRQPLLAVWARAYLDGQARRDERHALAEGAELGGGASDADGGASDAGAAGGRRDGRGDGEAPSSLERWHSSLGSTDGGFSLGLHSLAAPAIAQGGAATGPPPGWGLAIPWAWGVGGGRRSHVQIDPVQLFRRLRQAEVTEVGAQEGAAECADAGDTGAGGADAVSVQIRASLSLGAQEDNSGKADGAVLGATEIATGVETIRLIDFERFGGELLQVR